MTKSPTPPSAIRRLRDDARRIFEAGLAAADPHAAVLAALEVAASGAPSIAGREVTPPALLRIVAFGKAAVTMAAAATERIPPEVFPGPGIAVVNPENRRTLDRFTVFAAGHPVPDAAGVTAASEIARYLEGAAEDDAVLVLISGGGSALLPAPAEGVSLEDKMETTRLLLACGATIHELNTVRKHLSAFKGGGLARCAAPARIEALILSDVVGDDLSTVASGPTVPDPTTYADAWSVLAKYDLVERAPGSVLLRLDRGLRGEIPDTPEAGDPVFERVRNRLVGGNRRSLEAAVREAEAHGYETLVASDRLVGEAREAGGALVAHLRPRPAGAPPLAVLAGGETTVTVRGEGRGGRNQELALALALAARETDAGRLAWAFLSGGTDGRDGPTDAAGGLVDPGTVERCRQAGVDARRELDRNNSYAALEAAGDLLVTGPTGTNVADLQILLVGSEP